MASETLILNFLAHVLILLLIFSFMVFTTAHEQGVHLLPDFLNKLFRRFKGQWRIVFYEVYMPHCYNIQNTYKRYLFSLFFDQNTNVRKIHILLLKNGVGILDF